MNKELWYDPNKLLSYNRVLNFIIGARGIGKTYGYKKYVVKRFLKSGEQFIYIRRYRSELKKVKNFFNALIKNNEFPDVTFEVKGYEFYINKKLAGWAIPLSTWQNEKSNEYENVETIIFDEFIREKDKSGYLPNDVEAFLNIMDTIVRLRNNARAICMSNAVSVVNPYFLYFNLMPDIKKRFNAYKDIVVEIPDSQDFAQERRKSRFGSLIDGTGYGDMSLDNEFVNDSQVFIEKRSKDSRFNFAIVYKGLTMGLWVDVDMGLLYLSQDYDPSTKQIFALTSDDLTENNMMIKGWRNHYHLRKMVRAFMNGYLRFDNQVIRNVGYEIFKKMNIY
jgi:hypothetical protein